MSDNKRKTDYNGVNQKIQERIQRLNKPVKSSPRTMEKPEKKKTINNEEGD
jgi:hypothetical protein